MCTQVLNVKIKYYTSNRVEFILLEKFTCSGRSLTVVPNKIYPLVYSMSAYYGNIITSKNPTLRTAPFVHKRIQYVHSGQEFKFSERNLKYGICGVTKWIRVVVSTTF